MSRLFAFIASDPDRVRCLLHAGRKDLVSDARQADGWGIGFYQGGEILLQRRPKRPLGDIDFYAATAELRTDALVGHVRIGTIGDAKNENTHPFRFRSWLFAHHGSIPDFSTVQPKLLAAIPDFLRRNIRGQTDSEPVFHLILTHLHESNRLDDPNIAPREAGAALGRAVALLERLAPGASQQLDLVLTNGRILLALRCGSPMYTYRVAGIRDCPVCREGPEQGRAAKAIDHEHLRGIVLMADPPGPVAAPWEEVPERHLVSVHHDLRVEITPLALP